MITNPAYDLFLLMFNLTQLHNKDKIVELFIEGIQVIFTPVIFNYSLNAEQPSDTVFELRTRKSQYGVIAADGPLPPDKELCMLIKNSIQILAVTLEHLEYEQTLENERNDNEVKAIISLEELKKTVGDLKDSRTASINLIEDLSDEVEKRKETENALRENEKRLREAQEMAHLGFWLWDIKTGNVEWSEEVFKIFCLDAETFTPKIDTILSRSPWPEDNNRDQELIRRAIETHSSGSYEQKFLRPDNSIGYYYSTFRGNYDYNDDLISIVGTVHDITERKKAETALRESEDKFKYIFDHSVIGKSITLPSGEMDMNNALRDMLGYRKDELDNTKWQDITHPDDIEMNQNAINSLITGEKDSIRIIKRYIHKNGSVVWTDVGTALRRDENGTPLYFLAAINDITELKRAEAELRLQSEIMGHMAEAVYLVRMEDGIIVFTNSKFEELFGYEPGEMTGKHVSIVNAPTDKSPEETANDVLGSLAETGNWKGEVKNLRKDGTSFWTAASVTIFDHSHFGKVLVAVQRDITNRKIAESQIRQLNEDLELRVIQRTEQLQAANRELEAFSYSVSHDLRAPLRAIHSFTSILHEDYGKVLDKEGNRICNIIEKSSEHMGQLIDDLLAFSRVGRTGLEHLAINMELLVKSIYSELTTPEEQKRIAFTVGKLQTASGDAVMLRQVFTNLLSNALKYTSKNETADIIVGSESDDHEIIYYVKDNGVGFDMQYSNKLFGVFQRLHSMKEFEGNGVGLAIVQRIILRHEGRVWAEGEKGNGATFYFALPVNKNE